MFMCIVKNTFLNKRYFATVRLFSCCIYVYIYTHMYIYIYIYIYRERERQR